MKREIVNYYHKNYCRTNPDWPVRYNDNPSWPERYPAQPEGIDPFLADTLRPVRWGWWTAGCLTGCSNISAPSRTEHDKGEQAIKTKED